MPHPRPTLKGRAAKDSSLSTLPQFFLHKTPASMLQGFSDWLKGTQPGGRPESAESGATPRRLYPTLPELSSPTSFAGKPQAPVVATLIPELSKLSISHSHTKNVPATAIRSSVPPTSPPRLQALAFELPSSPFSKITGGKSNANANSISDTNGPSSDRTPPKRRVPRSSKTPTKTKPNSPGAPGLPNSPPSAPPSTIGLVKEEPEPSVVLDDLLVKLNSEKVNGFPDEEKLLKHQVEARVFLAKGERSEIRGGQLHDDVRLVQCYEMGLGKTVQMITRILDSKLLQKEVGSTLIVVPNCLMGQWKEELKRFAPKLSVLVHHGPDRASSPPFFRKYDVIITTYDIVMNEHKNTTKPPRPGRQVALMKATFLRIILDEAHRIKNCETQKFKACFELTACYRWGVTGTPCQNSVEDYLSSLRFLRAKPYDDPARFGSLSMEELKEFMKPFTLRRTKSMKGEDGKPLIELPPRMFKLEEVPFDSDSADHKAFYDALQGRYETVGNKYLNDAEYKDVGYVCSLLLLLRLRQACLHPDLILKYVNGEDKLEKTRGSRCCRICLMDIETKGLFWCKYCDEEIVPKAKPLEAQKFHPDKRPSSAKIHKMLDLIRKTLERFQGTDKIIVYSQFTSYLDILQMYIIQAGWEFVRYDGTMSPDKKETALKRLREDPRVRVALFSLKAGSVGLNLNSANVVILMDPWWNPAIEDQAFDRVHRIGQSKTVYIHKLLIPDTIEERIEQLQRSKRIIATFMTEGDTVEIGAPDLDQKNDLRFLLGVGKSLNRT